MFVYRPHRGSLEDSMKEQKYFYDIEEMKQYISDDINGNYLGYYNRYIEIDDIIIIEKSNYDSRIDWKYVKQVCVKKYGDRDFINSYNCAQCVGYMGEVDNINYVIK